MTRAFQQYQFYACTFHGSGENAKKRFSEQFFSSVRVKFHPNSPKIESVLGVMDPNHQPKFGFDISFGSLAILPTTGQTHTQTHRQTHKVITILLRKKKIRRSNHTQTVQPHSELLPYIIRGIQWPSCLFLLDPFFLLLGLFQDISRSCVT